MKLNNYIDHTLLKPTATKLDIIKLCEEAEKYQFYSVCVNGCYVKLAAKQLKNSKVNVCAVVGFPLGAMNTKAKVFEAIQALKDGADEIDMVINIGALKSASFKKVKNDIRKIKKIMPNKVLKVILETCFLTDEEVCIASKLALKAGADFIKTSTGFGSSGATAHHVKLMKSVVNDGIKIKASGGIKDAKTAETYIKLGASRLGTSSGIAIVSGQTSENND
ncbi:MAG: deoxyribose-phosphate aldolase [Flavobacteriaceae bacterium]